MTSDATTRAELAPLLGVGSLLERGVDRDTILAAIVDDVVARLGADRGTLYLIDRDRNEIFSKAAHLPELREIRLAIGKGVAGAVADTGKLVNLPDPYADQRFEKSVDATTGYVTDSMLVAPIRDAADEIIGVLQVLNKKVGNFDADDEAVVQTLAAQAGQVLERTSLYSELKPRAKTATPRRIDYRYNRIIGVGPAMQAVYALIDKAAATTATVLLQGESGTGKGLIARAIHVNSDRRDRPFVKVDCASLPPSLIENELFGHERGAFTGADRAAPGKFELAEGGTVFVDEIGELPLSLQSKLLRVVQEHEFERVGGTRTVQVDFRLIAATHRDLETMVAEGSFRADLYYRIRVVPIGLPALRERGAEDITRLVEHFLDVFTKKHHRQVDGFSAEAMTALLNHFWPGNIRELENCIESAVVLTDDAQISKRHLSLPRGETTNPRIVRGPGDLSLTLGDVEREYILAVLADCQGNQSEAARRLGIGRNTLGRKLKDYGLVG